MQQQIFTDGIGKISVISGVVRLDFMVYAPAEADAPGQPRQILTHQVLMGAEAFMRAASQCAEAAKQLQATNQTPAPQPAPKPAAPAPSPPPPAPVVAAPAPAVAAPAPAAAAPATPMRKPDASPWTANLKPVAPMQPFP